MPNTDLSSNNVMVLPILAELLLWLEFDRAADEIYAVLEDALLDTPEPSDDEWGSVFG